MCVCASVFQTVSVPEFDGRGLSAVRKFESNQLPANTPNEDRRSSATCLQVCMFSPHSAIQSTALLSLLVNFNGVFCISSSQRACCLECLTATGGGRVPRLSASVCCTTLQSQWCQSRAWRSLRTAWRMRDLFLPSCSGTNTMQTSTIGNLLPSTSTTSESSGKN